MGRDGDDRLRLDGAVPIARGGHRTVYPHPDDPGLCVKVLHEPWRLISRRLNDPLRHLRPRRHFDENRGELHELARLKRRLGPLLTTHFPAAHGLVETDLGEGLVVDRILDADGRTALTLKNHLWLYGLEPDCKAALDDFWRFLLMHRVMVRDPHPHNIVVQHRGGGGGLRIVMIDGFGSSDLLPFRAWFAGPAARKLASRRRRTERRIGHELAQRSAGHSPTAEGMLRYGPGSP
jgi:hypothetical protein